MSDELHRAADIARMFNDRTGRCLRPVDVGRLARKGRVPIALRRRDGMLMFSDRALSALLQREWERNNTE